MVIFINNYRQYTVAYWRHRAWVALTSIGSGHGLSTTQWQAITKTSADRLPTALFKTRPSASKKVW